MLDLEKATTQYPVEVSGWDTEHNFFVEKTTLEWSEASGRTVLVRRRLQQGALMFVRLAGPLQTAYPLAYRVKAIQRRGARGLYCAHLEQMRGEGSPANEGIFGQTE